MFWPTAGADRAESLRRRSTRDVVMVLGCESRVFVPGFLPAADAFRSDVRTSAARARSCSPSIRCSSAVERIPRRRRRACATASRDVSPLPPGSGRTSTGRRSTGRTSGRRTSRSPTCELIDLYERHGVDTAHPAAIHRGRRARRNRVERVYDRSVTPWKGRLVHERLHGRRPTQARRLSRATTRGTSSVLGPVAPRQCGRCRSVFPGDSSSDPSAAPKWWACPACRVALFGDGADEHRLPLVGSTATLKGP